jgi:8-hydroxy-5-deazaflavin:NADPH oxidoreductase
MKISFIGAGNVATNLGSLFNNAGHTVFYGKRQPNPHQLSIAAAINQGEIVCFAVPFNAMKDLLIEFKEALSDKIVIDVTNPININDWSPLLLGEENSAGEEIAKLLPKSKVVKAFNAIFADVMTPEKQVFNGEKLTAFIASDSSEAAKVIKNLADEAGFSGFIVGGIKNARYLEAMAHLNIAIAGSGGTNAGFKFFQN